MRRLFVTLVGLTLALGATTPARAITCPGPGPWFGFGASDGADYVNMNDFNPVGPACGDMLGGTDTFIGERGISRGDRIDGSDQADDLTGNDGGDLLLGGAGSDTVIGNEGPDTLKGAGGDDFLSAGDGGDEVWDGNGTDEMYGGAGLDTVYLCPDGNPDTYQGFEYIVGLSSC